MSCVGHNNNKRQKSIDEMKRIQNQKDETIHKIQLDLDNLRFENSQLKQSFSKCAGQIQTILVALQHLEKTNKGYEPAMNEIKMKTFEAGTNTLLEAEATNNGTRSQSG
ncbi:hypothetical protein DPMN_091498 [Dreissena polymorpha]|uniref:Uncharacterized protein n=1 Tax=Dreissena polymorpha TaxID=45954 RepID=A0A9D4R0S2_DREPO|nr:hypothetical protein DPMN_091498 [Dreissena polymorpha]